MGSEENAAGPGDPKNPMKVVKIFFKEPDYYIHGTDDVGSLGSADSHGCLRMAPEDVMKVGKWVMDHGGEPREENWFYRVLHSRREEKVIYLSSPVPIIVSNDSGMSQTAFLERSRHYLAYEYPMKIRLSLEAMEEEAVWRRPHEDSNSVGNLMLHLAGNIRQWIVCGVGGAQSERNRAAEFASRGGYGKAELWTCSIAPFAKLMECSLRSMIPGYRDR